MAVTQQQQPQQVQTNNGGQPTIASTSTGAATSTAAENVSLKRHRRPSVRLGEIGDQPAAALTKHGKGPSRGSRTRPITNLGTLDEEGDEVENLDNLAIGNWKTKGAKSKRVRTNWVSKIDEGEGNNVDGEGGFSKEFEMEEEQSPDHSLERVPQNIRARIGDDGVELDGPSDNGAHSARGWGREDGVRVWLNGLGLGRYWPVFEIHEVDEEVLPLLTLEDLKDMGINAVGSRRKLFCAIQKLNKVFS